MSVSLTRRAQRDPRRTVVTAGVALAVATCAVGATASNAQAATAPARTYRVLSSRTTSNDPQDSPTVQLEYTSPHDNRYVLTRTYAGSTLTHVTWQDQHLLGGPRSLLEIRIDTARRTWVERELRLPARRSAPLGIRSSARKVRHAIADGEAHLIGLGRKDHRRVRLLFLVPSERGQGTTDLWVNPTSFQPVAEAEAYTSGRYNFIVRSRWKRISRRALNRLRAKPKTPAGFSVSRP